MTELGGNLFLLLCVSVSLWLFLLGALNASRQLRDYLSVLLLCEGAHCLGAHAAVRGRGQNHARHRLVVGRFGDGDGVVLPHHDVKRLLLAAHLHEWFPARSEPRLTRPLVADSV